MGPTEKDPSTLTKGSLVGAKLANGLLDRQLETLAGPAQLTLAARDDCGVCTPLPYALDLGSLGDDRGFRAWSRLFLNP